MTTAKQAAANKTNAKLSTGAKTSTGKEVASANAIKHGILSKRLILDDESAEEYSQLFDGLVNALQPVGVYELVLVEKMASAIWRQARLTNAERAGIELQRRMEHYQNRRTIEQTLGFHTMDDSVTVAAVQPFNDEDSERVAWCNQVLTEYESIDEAELASGNLEALRQTAPLMFEQFEREAAEDGESLQAYLTHLADGLTGWAYELSQWCGQQLGKHARRGLVHATAELVRAERSAPFNNELLARYQASLDAELYKAAEALRKQQEWRLKALVVDAEAA